jgi:hypothetical protein
MDPSRSEFTEGLPFQVDQLSGGSPNGVARMQQSRHRKMTQELLDLKRLYWNLRQFRIGRRKGQTPYGLLGLNVPDLSFWEFLKLTPGELREKLSALGDTP